MKKYTSGQVVKAEGFISAICFALLATIVCAQWIQAAERNIIVFVTDDESPTLGCYGDHVAVTPAIDAMAADGVVQQAVRSSCLDYIITPMVSMGTSMTFISLQVGMTLSACRFLEH